MLVVLALPSSSDRRFEADFIIEAHPPMFAGGTRERFHTMSVAVDTVFELAAELYQSGSARVPLPSR